MITIKSEREIALLKVAGNIVYKTHQYLKPFIKEGITTNELKEKTLCEEHRSWNTVIKKMVSCSYRRKNKHWIDNY